jgi:SSS family solute:Na+ symporter
MSRRSRVIRCVAQVSATYLDALILAAYLATLAAIGVWFGRRQTTLDNFLVASRRMAWLPVGLSLMAALNSGIDYLTQPSATIQYGLALLVGPFSWFVIYAWVATVVFPFYRRLPFYSVYEYLEERFDVRVRMLGALIFVVWRLGWMATALYVPALAIDAVTGGAVDLTLMIVVLGALVTFYTMAGGIQAVIWNDVLQFCVMFGGLAATVAIVIGHVPGGAAQVWSAAEAAGKTALWIPLAPPPEPGLLARVGAFFTQPLHVPALLAALIVGRMAQYTSDQVLVQRLQTTETLRDTRRAFVIHAIGDAVWMVGLSIVGLALFAYFQYSPAPAGLPADRLLPRFMSDAFPTGALGLVIAAILAASLSSIDSAIHSCSSVLVVDIYQRFLRGAAVATTKVAEARQVQASRVATVLVGILGTTLACNVARIGSLIEVANKLINAFTGPLFGIFLLGMFTFAGSRAALIGGAAGTLTAYVVAYHSPIGFLWPSTFGLAVTLLVGVGAGVGFPDASSAARRYTWRGVMQAMPVPDERTKVSV